MAHRRVGLISRLAVLALAAVLALPALVFAGQGRGKNKNKGRGKPTEVFVNGHDARDGRWDKGGPKNKNKNKNKDRDRDRDDDDDRYDDDDDRYEDDDRYDRGRVRQVAFDNGYREGFQEGREDRAGGERFDYNDEGEFRDATRGYRNEYGSVDTYRGHFRDGYARGYRDGYEGRSSNRRTGVGGVLGDILGIP